MDPFMVWKMKTQLLVDNDAFWKTLEQDILSAHKRVLIKILTFEGDETGLKLARALMESRAKEKKVLVDSYSLWALSDHILFAPHNWFRPSLWRERRSTVKMFQTLRKRGIDVKIVHPPSFDPVRLAHRDHKKLVCVDDAITYIGGFNFSDHNFAWHDMMVRFENHEINRFFAEDFYASWEGENRIHTFICEHFHIIVLDGVTNEKHVQPIFEVIESARESIYIVNPYITDPFLNAFLSKAHDGVHVHFLFPEKNNRSFLTDYLFYHVSSNGRGSNVIIHTFPRMIHMKAFCIDRRVLVFGSANFDFTTYRIQPEYLVITDDTSLVQTFLQRVWEADLEQAKQFEAIESSYRGKIWSFFLERVDKYLEKKKIRLQKRME